MDATEFSCQRRNPHDIGFTKSVNSGRDKGSIFMNSCLMNFPHSKRFE